MKFNALVEGLRPYPMVELNRIKKSLLDQGIPIYDFGTGDPRVPTWPPIRTAASDGVPEVSQYPSVKGSDDLINSIWSYLQNRFGLSKDGSLSILSSNGSKEAVFHLALCVVGREGRRKILYPNPGYPVYKSGTLFAGGEPVPMTLRPEDGFLMKPWELEGEIQNQVAAIWVNYPHNPTGAIADEAYYRDLIQWAEERNVLILSDECYVDIYRPDSVPPLSLSGFASSHVFSLMSLSKRSGLTGYRSGFILGPTEGIEKLARARANFGVGTPVQIQAGAMKAWSDESHVADRREIFAKRMKKMVPKLIELKLLDISPAASFYLWCRIPASWHDDDVAFCRKLAERGVITTPSSWMGEGIHGYFRLALVPDEAQYDDALNIIEDFVISSAS